jgi:hypothetical protein
MNPNGKLPEAKEVQHVPSQESFATKSILHKNSSLPKKSAPPEEYVITQKVLNRKLHDKSSMTAKTIFM